MKNIDLDHTVQVLANFGVIAGILFLAFELHQNNELLEAQARFNHKETRANFLGEFDSNPELARISVKAGSSQQLTPEEQLQLDAYNDRMFVSWEWEFFESENGRLTLPVAGYRNGMITSPGARERWEQTKFQYRDEFVQFMDQDIIGP